MENPALMLHRRPWLALLALVLIAAACLVVVPSGQFAVRESYGGAVTPLGPGLHLRVPFAQRVYRYDSRPIVFDEAVEILTRDKASFKLPVKVNARASAGDVLTFHHDRSGREATVYIQERIRAAVLEGAARLNADQILDPASVRQFAQAVSADLLTHGIADDGVSVGSVAPQVVFNAVTDYLNRQFPASARRLAELSLGRDANEALFHAAMGMVLETEGKKPQAEEEYLNALYLDPTSLPPMSRLYVMYQSSSDAARIAKLQRLLEASLEKKKDSAVHHDWLGQVYLREGRLDRAELAFTTAIGLAPKNPEFRISLGGLRARQGKYDEAVQAFEEALTLQPDNRLALFDLGTAYALLGKYGKAIETFKRAERAGQPSAALYNALAQACEENHDPKAAIGYLRRSLAIKPQQPDRREQLRRLQAKVRS